MQQLVRQLESVRETGRRLLLAQRVLRWLAIFLAIALLIAVVDYLLRLPGWLRLVAGITLALILGWRLVTWVLGAAAFRPSLGSLAMRAELLFPQLSGSLASGVEFVLEPDKFRTPHISPDVTAEMTHLSVKDLETRMNGVDLRQLIAPKPTVKQAMLAGLALVIVGGMAIATPEYAALAVKRWLMPLSDVQWPLRINIESKVSGTVWPTDTPLRLQAKVSKGYTSGMRAWVQYRLMYADGSADAWRPLLMNDQSAGGESAGAVVAEADRGMFERLVELQQSYENDRGGKGKSKAVAATKIQFSFEAGDATTTQQEIALTERPALREFKLTITPPKYANGVIPVREVAMDRQTGTFVSESALTGSQLKWTLVLNKPIPDTQAAIELLMPGWKKEWASKAVTVDRSKLSASSSDAAPTIIIESRLDATIESPVKLADEHGLASLSDRVYRVEATVDQLPAATVMQPAMDEGVLATAVVPVEAMGTDDVALESLALEAAIIKGNNGAPPPGPTTKPADARTLGQTTGRNPRLNTAATVDLAGFAVKTGDEVHITAVAQDVFELDGKRHDPVRSLPRRLRVIDPQAMAAQLRVDLDAIRQQALRLEAQQTQAAASQSPQAAAAAQPDLTRAIENQTAMLKAVQDRIARNKLDDAPLSQLVQQARELSTKAAQAAKDSQPALDKAAKEQKDDANKAKEDHEKAKGDQNAAAESLRNLASLLDQGKDTAGIQAALKNMIAQQNQLAADSKKTQPQTMGLKPSDLKPEDKAKVDELATRQQALNRAADDLVRKLQMMADKQSREANTPAQQAAAQSLADAAKTAQQQNLQQQMQNAAAQTQQNKLGDAGKSQQSAAATMEEMAKQLANQDKVQQEVLKRKMMELADAVKKLIEQQKTQIDKLEAAKDAEMPGLSDGLSLLRRNTLVVAEDAKAVKQAAQPAQLIAKAGGYQADAIQGLRDSARTVANTGEKQSLAALESALEMLNKAAKTPEDDKKANEKKELREAYEKLAVREADLKKLTLPLSALEAPSRRERADMVDLGHKQADIQFDAAALAVKVKETFLFAHTHTRIDKTAGSVASRLREATADEALLADEDNLISMFKSLAQALKDAEKNDPFADEKESPSGGGEGGGGQAPLVPPVAELKLLRELQTVIHEQTRTLSQQKPTPKTEARIRREMQELAGQQNELSDLGVRLIEKMQKKAPGAPRAVPVEPGEAPKSPAGDAPER